MMDLTHLAHLLEIKVMKFDWVFTLFKNRVKPQRKLSSKALKLLTMSTSDEHNFILAKTSAGRIVSVERGVGVNNAFKE